MIPLHLEDAKPIRASRSAQPRRRSGRLEVVLPTKRQIYGSNPPAFENASRVIAEKNLIGGRVKKEEEEEKLALFIPLPYVRPICISSLTSIDSHILSL